MRNAPHHTPRTFEVDEVFPFVNLPINFEGNFFGFWVRGFPQLEECVRRTSIQVHVMKRVGEKREERINIFHKEKEVVLGWGV